MTTASQELETILQQGIGTQVFGADKLIHALSLALIAGGHVLLQGVPGLGKTLLGKTLARQLGGDFRRVQCTADLMPSDIIGVHVYDLSKQEFIFNPGPLFADVVLIDEINRTGPKTQSALLEAMEERSVTTDREAYTLSDHFLVIATQNPREFEGTYPLPESQLDRFLLQIDMEYPAREHEEKVLASYDRPGGGHQQTNPTDQLVTQAQIDQARQEAASARVSPEIYAYVLDIAQASREHPQVSLGLSTRGALALMRCARVEANLRGADFVTPDDVKIVAHVVMAHRLLLTPDAALDGITETQVVDTVLGSTTVPR